MPLHNNFRHQVYSAELPSCPPEYLTPPPPVEGEAFRSRMAAVGDQYRAAGVRAIYLVHGTFTGTDAWDLARWIGHLAPWVGDWARRQQKLFVDALLGDQGNFTAEYAAELQRSLASDNGEAIPVRCFHWASQNHHIGRADAALRLLDEFSAEEFAGGRLLLWGHSHAGNVFALLTNVLGAEEAPRRRFFDAVRPYYGRYGAGAELLQRIESACEGQHRPWDDVALDMVTLGSPVRYGWDAGGYARLLHFIYHRPAADGDRHRAAFPFSIEDVIAAAGGDYIQQIGIAGTNFIPHPLAWRTWKAEQRLNALLQPELRRRDLRVRLALGMRIPREGQTLLVDYGPQGLNVARHIAGHAVYTRREFMLFHAEEIARRFYGGA